MCSQDKRLTCVPAGRERDGIRNGISIGVEPRSSVVQPCTSTGSKPGSPVIIGNKNNPFTIEREQIQGSSFV